MPSGPTDYQPRTAWHEVKGRGPVCGRHGWCRTSPDGGFVACRRQDRGAVKRIDYRDGSQAWLHALGGRRGWGPAPPPRASPAADRPADPDLDRVYRVLLADPDLCLSHPHRQHLLRRGLADADLIRNGYRSLPAACRAGVLRRLRERLPDALLLATPGVIARGGAHGRYLTIAGRAGLLIPVRSAAGLVVGLVVRPDEPAPGRKYCWLSSAYHGGPSPGSRVHVPAGTGRCGRAVIVEGTLKADVVHALSRRPVIGLPGCHVTAEAVETLQALGVREALLALDADAASNPHVAAAQVGGLAALNAAGFDGGLVRWDPRLGKGLDDRLLSLRKGVG
jgi:hypothetical protein